MSRKSYVLGFKRMIVTQRRLESSDLSDAKINTRIEHFALAVNSDMAGKFDVWSDKGVRYSLVSCWLCPHVPVVRG
jgi:hypothetical protein